MTKFTTELIAKLQGEIDERLAVIAVLKNGTKPAKAPAKSRSHKWSADQRKKFTASSKKRQAAAKATKAA